MKLNKKDTKLKGTRSVENTGSKAGIHSVVLRFIIMLIIFVVFCTTASMSVMVVRMSAQYQTIMQDYLLDLAKSGETTIEREIKVLDTERALDRNRLASSVGDIKINGVESCYTYVVSGNGTMLYHPIVVTGPRSSVLTIRKRMVSLSSFVQQILMMPSAVSVRTWVKHAHLVAFLQLSLLS